MNKKKQIAIITGGAKRIGASICRRLHKANIDLIIHYKSSSKEAKLLQNELNEKRKNSASLIQADLLESKSYSKIINEAIKMLETAYASRSNDPYIIDSIGWAYYLVNDFSKAEKYLKRAVELMPDDPIVNDHYGDILWKLNRKIQARYFWENVLKMDDVEEEMLDKINIKLAEGLEKL